MSHLYKILILVNTLYANNYIYYVNVLKYALLTNRFYSNCKKRNLYTPKVLRKYSKQYLLNSLNNNMQIYQILETYRTHLVFVNAKQYHL